MLYTLRRKRILTRADNRRKFWHRLVALVEVEQFVSNVSVPNPRFDHELRFDALDPLHFVFKSLARLLWKVYLLFLFCLILSGDTSLFGHHFIEHDAQAVGHL